MNHNQRPVTENDLSEWERIETLAEVTLTGDGMRCGVLVSLNDMLEAFLAAETADQPVTVEVVGNGVIIKRPRPLAEIATRLLQAQARWDREHGQPAPGPVDPLMASGVSVGEVEANWPVPAGESMPGDTQHG